MTTRPSPRIGIYGPFGWGNLGDASIQEAMLHNLRQRHPRATIEAFSLNPDDTEEIHGIACHPILRSWRSRKRVAPPPANSVAPSTEAENEAAASMPAKNPAAAPQPWLVALKRPLRPLAELLREARFLARGIRILRRFDLFVVSGGGQLADFWGGPFYHPYTLMKWVACARLAGCRVVVVSVGAGPIRHPLSDFFLQLTLRMAHARSYRDVASHELVSRWGFPRRDPVRPDLAFSFPAQAPPPVVEGPATVGVSPMAYCHPTPGVWPVHDTARYREYLVRQASLVRGLLSDGHRVVLLSTQIRSDRYALEDLVELLRDDNGDLPVGVDATATRDLGHALEQISSCDVMVASRLHGVILSLRLHRPVMAVSYQQKVDSVVEQFELDAYRVDIDFADGHDLLHTVRQLLHERRAVYERVCVRADSHMQELQTQYDELFGGGEDA